MLQRVHPTLLTQCVTAPKTYVVSLLLLIVAVIILAGNSPSAIYPLVTAMSAFIFCSALVYLFSARAVFAVAISSLLVIALQCVNQLKVYYYKDQLLLPDLTMMADPTHTAHYPLAGLVLTVVAGLMVSMTIAGWRGVPRRTGRLPALVSLYIMAVSGVLLNLCVMNYHHDWSATLPDGTGVVSNLVMSGRHHHARLCSQFFPKNIKLNFASGTTAHNGKPLPPAGAYPVIVLLLQESSATTASRLYLVQVSGLLTPFSMFELGRGVKVHTLMQAPTFDGGRWLPEFAALTGLYNDDFGAQKGIVFDSTVGVAYHAVGMISNDTIIQTQELSYSRAQQDNLWPPIMVDSLGYVKKYILGFRTNKPLLIYRQTMYEHAP